MQLGINTQAICTRCPRHCGADRNSGQRGYCGANDEIEVASVTVHRGEEPPLNPIVNVFFAHCNLHCIYCQNRQISGQQLAVNVQQKTVSALADEICALLSTLHSPLSTPQLGLVTAAHYADRIPEILDAVRQRGFSPTVVYNSSGYESVETLRSLEGLIDIYLPDYKYADPDIAEAYSHAPDYPEVAQAALKEMRRQVGGSLKIDDAGHAYRGLIVRHLVLPGNIDNSLHALNWLADEFPFGLHLSLMAQYYPPVDTLPAPLNRTLRPEEYDTVVQHAVNLGLTDGWIQELDASRNYRPDFNNKQSVFK